VILGGLPTGIGLPIVVVQHRHRDSDGLLAELLQDVTPMPVAEVEDKDRVEPGRVFIAPPNYHLLIDDGHFALSTEEAVRFSRPSIDVTFTSAADEYGAGTIGVVLTGANDDGARGLRRIADRGGLAIVEEPATAEIATMPAAALRAVPTAVVLPVTEIAPHLCRVFTRSVQR
jgi:two-component system chemotaxis response regulator CheB